MEKPDGTRSAIDLVLVNNTIFEKDSVRSGRGIDWAEALWTPCFSVFIDDRHRLGAHSVVAAATL